MRRRRSLFGRGLGLAAGVVVAAALAQQLRRPPAARTWEGRVLGVPYDFRPPTLSRLRARWWNPDDPRVFTPRTFGVGWDLNIYRLTHLVAR